MIKLPVNAVLVSSEININRLTPVIVAMQAVKDFWAQIDIDIQPRISGMVADESILDFVNPELKERHYWEVRGGPLTLYIGWESQTVGQNFWGQASADGVAIIAGGNAIPGGGNFMDESISHELGHILGLGPDHEEGTFIRLLIQETENIITPAQRDKLRESAYQFGGY